MSSICLYMSIYICVYMSIYIDVKMSWLVCHYRVLDQMHTFPCFESEMKRWVRIHSLKKFIPSVYYGQGIMFGSRDIELNKRVFIFSAGIWGQWQENEAVTDNKPMNKKMCSIKMLKNIVSGYYKCIKKPKKGRGIRLCQRGQRYQF